MSDRAASCERHRHVQRAQWPATACQTNDGLALSIRDRMAIRSRRRQMDPADGAWLDPAETAVQQVKTLGYAPDDVRTATDPSRRDHAGGIRLSTRESASHRREEEIAVSDRGPRGPLCRRSMKHGPNWTFYAEGGEAGSASGCVGAGHRELVFDDPCWPCRAQHACAARQWLHAGDSYFFHGQMHPPVVRRWHWGSFSARPTSTAPRASPTRSGCGR